MVAYTYDPPWIGSNEMFDRLRRLGFDPEWRWHSGRADSPVDITIPDHKRDEFHQLQRDKPEQFGGC